jgi:hypothetical protein
MLRVEKLPEQPKNGPVPERSAYLEYLEQIARGVAVDGRFAGEWICVAQWDGKRAAYQTHRRIEESARAGQLEHASWYDVEWRYGKYDEAGEKVSEDGSTLYARYWPNGLRTVYTDGDGEVADG